MHHPRTHRPRHTVRRAAVSLVITAMIAALMTILIAPGSAAPPRPALPDLQVGKLGKTPASVRYGATFGLGAVVTNRGRSAARASTLRILLSRDKVPDRGDITAANIPVKRVPARKRKVVSGTVRVPADARGSYWVIACADARGTVRESKERNNCRVSPTPLTIDASVRGTLTGSLTFVDRGATDDGAGRTEEWHRTTVARVNMAVSGDPANRPTFNGAGSSYERTGTRTRRETTTDCLTVTTRGESGAGTLRATGDPFTDQVVGRFTRTDLSGVRLVLQIPGTWSETVTRTRLGSSDCGIATETRTGTPLAVHDVELREVSATATAITYRVVGWRADQNLPSEWDTVTGRLVLQLR